LIKFVVVAYGTLGHRSIDGTQAAKITIFWLQRKEKILAERGRILQTNPNVGGWEPATAGTTNSVPKVGGRTIQDGHFIPWGKWQFITEHCLWEET
jgi:hypothetical protein